MVSLSRVIRNTRQQLPEVHELAKSSSCRQPHRHVEFNAQTRLFWDKTTTIWSREPLVLQRFCRNTNSQPHQLICKIETPKISRFCMELFSSVLSKKKVEYGEKYHTPVWCCKHRFPSSSLFPCVFLHSTLSLPLGSFQ